MRSIVRAAIAVPLLLCPLPAVAQDAYPSRTVQVVVPYPAGGSTDPLVRIICDRLSRNLGQTFVVLNQPGAREFIDAYAAALEPVMAGYQRENKRHATIAVGCTGGKHRSVAIVAELAERLGQLPGVAVSVKHRDRGRE